jgi:hypothetical protein
MLVDAYVHEAIAGTLILVNAYVQKPTAATIKP